MRSIVYILFLLISPIVFGQNQVLFEQGNSLYNEGKYQEAINAYEAIIANGEHSAELYFNLANAYYKINSIAPTIYNYEKALQLNPTDVDIQNNLAFARNMTIDAIEVIPDIGFARVMNGIANVFSFDGWAYVTVGMVVLFVLMFLLYYFSYNTTKKRILFLSSFVFNFLGLIYPLFCF